MAVLLPCLLTVGSLRVVAAVVSEAEARRVASEFLSRRMPPGEVAAARKALLPPRLARTGMPAGGLLRGGDERVVVD